MRNALHGKEAAIMNKQIQEVLADPAVHNLTKDTLRAALTKDIVDAYFDVRLAADLLKERMERGLRGCTTSMAFRSSSASGPGSSPS